jgi:hypothetical protein
MSVQRRENRRQLDSTGYTRRLGHLWLAFLAWFTRVIASVGTAPPPPADLLESEYFHPTDENLSLGTPEDVATKSLQSDHRTTQLVRFIQVVHQDVRPRLRSAWPPRAIDGVSLGRPAAHRSSLPHIPVLPGLARLPLALP